MLRLLYYPTTESEFEAMVSKVKMSIQTELHTIKKLNTIAKNLM